ncbi:hypothetical protein SAMN05444007_1177 [Cribrihabitans marinus]|uniref:DUF192 domain-containing protein n=1 Tax=Cribrihabitans marinus TaxID=1227549 RepID=A0A1H7DYK4_9RHOB|nr:DUF192 domain-containing protein [Cribrihabitans marinus]GGH17741.1 hypothetical protein GCM10010973_00070 [Cribrihabitans marinus]SEK06811.1 hypothetical protein SAMN05444007_1177 [Cribrihabitans marinus]
MRALFLACLLWVAVSGAARAGECSPDIVTLRTDQGVLQFSVELADTPQERSRGLMFREDLPKWAGMLFVYERPQPASFWMKNTLIPLDMLFADRTGRVTRVHHRAVPGDLTPIDGGREVFAVLEINGGLAEELGLDPGAVMRHPAFAGGPAAWPC